MLANDYINQNGQLKNKSDKEKAYALQPEINFG